MKPRSDRARIHWTGRGLAALFCLWPLLLTHCRDSQPSAPLQVWELFSSAHVASWREATLSGSGGVVWEQEGCILKAGAPMTGITFAGWTSQNLPFADYAIEYEALRLDGTDFFGTVTFPVGSVDRAVSFVLGGWGGSQVGISSMDGLDAAANSTGSSQPFENHRWYHIRIEVHQTLLQVWLDGRPLVRFDPSRHQLHLRTGEIDQCLPFGFATYNTTARLRRCIIRTLPPPA